MYFNYKCTFSVTHAADANYNFIYDDVDCQGQLLMFKIVAVYFKKLSKKLHLPEEELRPGRPTLVSFIW